MAESVTFQNYEQLRDALNHLQGAGLAKVVERAAVKVGEQFKERLQHEPIPNRNYPLKWASKKQRAWFFASRKGKGLPYQRGESGSQNVGKSWAIGTQRGGAIVGNRATYASYVQSDEYQTEMHRETGWPTDKSVDEELKRTGIIPRIVAAEIKSMLDGVFG